MPLCVTFDKLVALKVTAKLYKIDWNKLMLSLCSGKFPEALNEWMNGWMKEWMNETNDWLKEWVNESTSQQSVIQPINRSTNQLTN